jgi:peroxiredoxin
VNHKIERFSDITVIVVGICFLAALAHRYWPRLSPPRKPADAVLQLKGKHVGVDGLNVRTGVPTVLLVLSTRCRFCAESMPFYRRLSAQRVNGKGFRLVAVSSENSEKLKSFIAAEGVSVDAVLSSSLPGLGIRSVPALLLVGREGRVVDVWTGALGDVREREVLTRLDELGL